jgi:dienelactone hydrolase
LLAAEPSLPLGRTYEAQDTLACGEEAMPDARECLTGLTWTPGRFPVRCDPPQPGLGDVLVRFPSPVSTGSEVNDEVALEWYAARDADENLLRAPAIVVVHESGRSMPVGRAIAAGLRALKLHAFLIQLPGYGVRRTDQEVQAGDIVPVLRQAIADVRRARDAVAVLPGVDPAVIGLQGTSLGGFVAATVAGLDRGYDRTFILLAGGNLHEVIEQGARDSAKLRERLKAAGIEGDKLRTLTRVVEPLRLAHRIDPHSTWLYSGRLDDVVPPASSRALAVAAHLPADRHIELPVNHYSGIVLLPRIVREISQAMLDPLPQPQ